jgi:hypothetical protein
MVVFKWNVVGNGRDIENSAEYGVRVALPEYHKFEKNALENEPELQAIKQAPGVASIACYHTSDKKYELSLKKGSAYDWVEINAVVMPLLEARDQRLSRE